MVKHLDQDYELENPKTGFVEHFYDTIDAIGGWKGFAVLSVIIIAFYALVVYTIQSGREKREKAKKRR